MAEYRVFSRWSFEEIIFLIEKVKESRHVKLLMDSSIRATTKVYKKLSRRMVAGGFLRNHVQICTKFKSLRLNFYRTVHLAGENPEATKKSPFFDEMKAIWVIAGKPRPHGGSYYSLGLSTRAGEEERVVTNNEEGNNTEVQNEETTVQQSTINESPANSTELLQQMNNNINEQFMNVSALLNEHTKRLTALEDRVPKRKSIRRRQRK